MLGAFGLRVPLAVKRGYHRHFRPRGNAGLARPVVDVDLGYCVAPMEQGLRLTTGAEFAPRDAPPTPAQLDRLLPVARALFPLGDPVEAEPWLGSRPCFADSRPVIGPAPGQAGLWLAFGHDRLTDLIGLVYLEVERIEVGREHADVALADIFQKLGRMAQDRKSVV